MPFAVSCPDRAYPECVQAVGMHFFRLPHVEHAPFDQTALIHVWLDMFPDSLRRPFIPRACPESSGFAKENEHIRSSSAAYGLDDDIVI